MKNAFIATLSSLVVSANAKNGFRGFVNDVFRKNDAKTEDAADGITAIGNEERNLWPAHMPMNSCSQPAQWHPTYSAGWSHGYCQFTIDCDSPGYASELQCCNAAYGHQNTGFCLSQLPNPPTSSPTDIGGPSIYYPDYDSAWPDAGCINTRPMPSGRPTYTSMLACCKAAYAGQMSGKCLSMLPSPPTGSPTSEDYEADFWYPMYELPWSVSGCSNKLPLPYNNINDRPNYSTQIQCCKTAYAGQISGMCLSMLPNAPTLSPTETGGLSIYYPDYDSAWPDAGCINTRPMPSGRPTYTSMLACCKGAYAGQMSGKCLSMVTNQPAVTNGFCPNYATPFDGPGAACHHSDCCCVNAETIANALINGDVQPGHEDDICVRDHAVDGFTVAHVCVDGGITKTACCTPGLASPISEEKVIAAPLRGLTCTRTNALPTVSPTVPPTVTVAPSVSVAPSDVPSLSGAPSVSAAPSDAPSVSVSPTSSSAPTKKPPTTLAPTATCQDLSIRPFDGPGAACHHSDCCCVNAETVKWALINGDVQVGNEDDICVRDHGADGFTVAHNCVGVGTIKTACCRPGLPNAISEPKVISAPLRGGTCNKIN